MQMSGREYDFFLLSRLFLLATCRATVSTAPITMSNNKLIVFDSKHI